MINSVEECFFLTYLKSAMVYQNLVLIRGVMVLDFLVWDSANANCLDFGIPKKLSLIISPIE